MEAFRKQSVWLWKKVGSVSSTPLKCVKGRTARLKADDREGFDTEQAEFEVRVAADTEWKFADCFALCLRAFVSCPP